MMKLSIKPEKDSYLYKIDQTTIKKIIRITGVLIAVVHMLNPVATALYGIIVPTLVGLDFTFAIMLLAEVAALLIYMKISGKNFGERFVELLKEYFTKDQLLLGMLPLLYFASIVINTLLDGFVRHTVNSRYLYDLLVNVFVIYPLGRYYAKNKMSKVIEIFIHVFLTGMTIYMAYIIFKIFNGESIYHRFIGSIEMKRLEFDGIPEYHLQLNAHHNTTGAIAGTMMLLCICMSVWKKGTWRIVYLMESFVHSIILVLANSRSTFIAGAMFLAMYLGIISYFVIKHKVKDTASVRSKIIQWFPTLIVVAGSFVVMCLLRGSVFDIYKKTASGDANAVSVEVQDIVSAELESVSARNLDVSNLMYRDRIWGFTIRGILMSKRNILIGVTPPGVGRMVKEASNGEMATYSHNQLLEIAASLGIPGLFVFMIWLIFLANRCIIIGLAVENRISLRQKLVPLLVFYLIMFNMVEAILFFYNSFIGGLFMITSGWCFEAVRSAKVNSRVFRIRADALKVRKNEKNATDNNECGITDECVNDNEKIS